MTVLVTAQGNARRLAQATHAETRKLITLPSLRWAAALTWGATLLIAFAVHRAAPAEDPVRVALLWTQAGFLIFGVLAVAQEYEAGGQIHATLLAVPQRGRLAAAKGVALLVATLILIAPAVAALSWSRASATIAPYLISLALIGAATGTLLRSPLAAVGLLLTAYLVAFPLTRARFPTAAWLPDTPLHTPLHGTLTTAIWTLAALTTATAALRLRNA